MKKIPVQLFTYFFFILSQHVFSQDCAPTIVETDELTGISNQYNDGKLGEDRSLLYCFRDTMKQELQLDSLKGQSGLRLEKGAKYVEGSLCLGRFGMNARAEFFVFDELSLGANLGYITGKQTGEYGDYNVLTGYYLRNYEIRTNLVYFTPFVRWYMVAHENLGVYIGLSAGYGNLSVKSNIGNYQGYSEASGVVGETHVGIKYHVTSKTALVGEFGYGMSFFRIGASVTL